MTESEPTVRVCDRVCPKLKHDKMIDFKRQFSGTCDSLRLRNSSAEVEAISMLLTSTVSVPLSRTPSPRCSSVYSLLHCYVQYFKKKKVQKSLDVFFCTSCTLNQFIRLTSAMLICLSTDLKSEEKKRIKCYFLFQGYYNAAQYLEFLHQSIVCFYVQVLYAFTLKYCMLQCLIEHRVQETE